MLLKAGVHSSSFLLSFQYVPNTNGLVEENVEKAIFVVEQHTEAKYHIVSNNQNGFQNTLLIHIPVQFFQ